MKFLAFLVLLVGTAAAGCASSAATGCDPATESCACTVDSDDCAAGYACVGEICVSDVDGGGTTTDAGATIDAAFSIDAGPVTDAAPKLGFGEPCSDKGQCDSNICILVGIGGVCSETCVAGSCPMDFGCVGVFGAIDPGEVADVCVPETTQLCTQCASDTECSLIGNDKCVEYEPGKKFCGRDCSAIGCPDGYACQTVSVDSVDYEQCVPNSGACDCNAALTGNTEACEITTPFGTCAGQRTCGGASGWGGCDAPSTTDSPDGTFTDDNCDGIDGDLTKGLFVSMLSGTDSGTCGLVYTEPCATINHGILRAVTESRGELYVQRGDYTEIVVMINGIDIYGGYDLNWQRDVHTLATNKVTITGGKDDGVGGDGEYLTIRAHDLIVPTVIADLVVVGPNASGTVSRKGKGSYAVHVDAAKLNLRRISVEAGDGADGSTGSTGLPTASAGASSAMNGKPGGRADESIDTCDSSSHGDGGGGGTNSCSGPSTRAPNAGRGGHGGEMDGSCTWGVCTSCTATPGDVGVNASFVSGTSGTGGGGGSGGNLCGPAGVGRSGRVANGGPGGGASASAGVMSGSYWYGTNGGPGSTGSNGGGGGGGGGSGGCDSGIDSYGAGGGGGGAGGCAATSGGGGGGAGGGSFGVFVVNAAVVDIAGCTVARGNGGGGGSGGDGGHGQVAGTFGNGGLANGDSKAGALGAAGGHGGHGGGGGGGGGGMSAGLFLFNATLTQDCTVAGGSRGALGAGGASAPNAPAGIRDGVSGSSGAIGEIGVSRTCAAASGC